jgi:hypothetical protein
MRYWVAVLGIAVLAPAPASAQPCTGCPAASFAPAARYSVLPPLGDPPATVAVDLNGDGFPDLVVVAFEGVAVLLADGAGGFGPATLFPGPMGEGSIVAADFDRDGHADIVTTAGPDSGARFFFWRGDGNGSLEPPVTTTLPAPALSVAATDLDADGKPDLVVGLGAGSAVLMGDGHGGFGPAQVVGSELVTHLTLNDLNHDGRPDLVSVGPQGVTVRLGNGSGGFGPAALLTAGQGPRDVEAADVDGDGNLDLVVLNYGEINSGDGASVSVLRGNGAGSFGPAVDQPVANAATALAVGDFDRDGHADAAVASSRAVTVLLGQPNASLLPHLVAETNGAVAIATADFDRDGFPDVATLANQSAILYLGDGTGGLELAAFVDTGSRPRGMAAGDLDGDGVPDLAVSRETNDVEILLGRADGFVAGPTIPVGAKPGSLAVADFNNDGRLDLAVLADAPDRVRIFLATAGGGFSLVTSFAAGPFPGGLAVGDLNGDGRPDIVAGNAQEGEQLYTFLGNGDGTFGGPLTVAADKPSSPILADVNQDGHLDVITVPNFQPVYLGGGPRGATTTLQLFLGNGDGSLQPAISLNLPSPTTGLALGDANGDGYPDLFSGAAGGIYLALNDGSGHFRAPALIYSGLSASFITLADVNGDGHLDVISGDQNGIKVLVADGIGGFQAGPGFAQRNGASTLALDLDGDSRAEIVYPSFHDTGGGGVNLLKNTNCQARRFRIATDLPTCNTPGVPFATQPVIHWVDDGGNLLHCAVGNVNAVFVPGTGTPGATILGTTTVPFVSGVATFSDLAVDLPGSYQLKYEGSANQRRTRGRSFSQGLTVGIDGPAVVQAGTSASYAASPGFQWYDWALDAAPVSTAQSVTLGFPVNGTYALAVAARQDGCTVAANRDIVAGPLASVVGNSVVEGDTGQTGLDFTVSLSATSAVPVTVSYSTADLTALSGSDYVAASGSLSFAPGETVHTLPVMVLGDLEDEPDEVFALELSGGSNAVTGGGAKGRILDDDGTLNVGLPQELAHGSERRESLASLGGLEQSHWYLMRQAAGHSYEVSVDAVSGDVVPLRLERLDAGGAVLQAASAGAGGSASLRFENSSGADVSGERFQVRSGGCTAACGPEAGYRIRAYDTSDSDARFNNAATQITILLLENTSSQAVTGHAHFWNESGALLYTDPFSLGPRQTLVVNTATLPGLAGQQGTVSVASDAPYGTLAGKTSAVEPAFGFTFDTPLQPRPR